MATTERKAQRTAWQIDPAHTQVEFSVKHMMFSRVRGRFNVDSGLIHADPENPENARVEVDIDASSIDTGVEDRDQHLRSEDFLNVEAHPKVTFRSTRVEGGFDEPGDQFRVVGDLTVRGESRETTLDVTYEGAGTDPWGNTRAAFRAVSTVDRRDWGITWNQALETGGILVGHDLDIEINVQAVEQDDEE